MPALDRTLLNLDLPSGRVAAMFPCLGSPTPSLADSRAMILEPAISRLDEAGALVLLAPTSEAVHALRGALRRTGAVVDLLAPVFTKTDRLWIRGELKWLARRFSRTRDLDVLIARLALSGQVYRSGLQEDVLVAAASRARISAAADAVSSLRSARATAFLAGLVAWTEVTLDAPCDCPGSVAAEAAAFLARGDAEIRGAGRALAELGRRRRHKLRSRIKRQRYAGEAVAELFPAHLHGPYLAALAKLHHILGHLNDGVVGAHLARRLSPAVDVLSAAGYDRAHRHELRRRLLAAWSEYETVARFWTASRPPFDGALQSCPLMRGEEARAGL